MRRAALFLIVVIVTGLSATNGVWIYQTSLVQVVANDRSVSHCTADLVPHDPIAIDGNTELEAYALAESWTGNGSQLSPYMIDGYDFFSTGECLKIMNTTSHFIIQNCSFGWSTVEQYSEGIQLRNVTSATVWNCTFTRLTYGIRALYSRNCTLANLTGYNNRWYAISLWHCQDFIIDDNDVTGGLLGIGISNTPGLCSIKRNTFTDSSLVISGENLLEYIHDISDNIVNGKPLGFFQNVHNTTIDMSGYGAVLIVNASNVEARNGIFMNSTIRLAFARNCTISNVECWDHRLAVSWHYGTNCTLRDSAFYGTYNAFQSVRSNVNCTVLNNTFYNTVMASAVYINGAQGARIINNTFIASGESTAGGIEILSGNHTIVRNNTITKHSPGIRISHSYYCDISLNRVSNNTGAGCYISSSSEINLLNNSFSYNGVQGVAFDDSFQCELTFNEIEFNGNVGVQLWDSSDCTITNNTISHNDSSGIYANGAINCAIVNNSITWNDYWGIDLESDVSSFEVYWNRIGWNTQGNARDDGSSNAWDDGITRGNAWSDYEIPPYYDISGTAGSRDHYPSVIVDLHAPHVIADHTPTSPTPIDNVTVTAEVIDVSELSKVLLYYSTNGGVSWTNISMVQNPSGWIAVIPEHPQDTQIMYKVYASDIYGNWAWSLAKVYYVVGEPSTTTTSTFTTPTTDTSITSPTEPTPIGSMLLVGISVGGVVVVIVLILIYRRQGTV